MLEISSVKIPSPASSAGFRRGDRISSCNGIPLEDWLDFLFNADGSEISLEYSRGGLFRSRTLRRNPGTEWGFTFTGQEPRRCRRKCIFCFVDQLPPGVRQSLLLKDDDVRYSFIQGTYVTLHPGDVEYAIARSLSPLHVSVHATDPSLRGYMLGTGRDEPVMEHLSKLSGAGIRVETQIVVVPGVNDGERLESTVSDLFTLSGVQSVGVVPVGLTCHRKGLPSLRRPEAQEAGDIIDLCSVWRTRAMEEGRGGWIYPSDEMFLIAGRRLPPPRYYSRCTLRENGIGMLTELESLAGRTFTGGGLVCTGSMAAPFLERILAGSGYRVVEVENRFLGSMVGAAGLLAGQDVAGTVMESRGGYNRVILPSVMFNHDMLTIDDLSPGDISRLTGSEVKVADSLRELE